MSSQKGHQILANMMIHHYWLVVWNIFVFFHIFGNNHPNWLVFFRGVETTNQITFCVFLSGNHNKLVGHTESYYNQKQKKQNFTILHSQWSPRILTKITLPNLPPPAPVRSNKWSAAVIKRMVVEVEILWMATVTGRTGENSGKLGGFSTNLCFLPARETSGCYGPCGF